MRADTEPLRPNRNQGVPAFLVGGDSFASEGFLQRPMRWVNG
jgi:hypothetical protein